MSERQRKGFNVEPEDLRQANEVFLLVERGIKEQRAIDPVEASFFLAAYPELLDGGKLRPHLEEAIAFRRTTGSFFPSGYALRTLEFSIDKQARRLLPGIYPQMLDTPEAWEHYDVLGRLDQGELHWDMQINLQSSMADAYGIYQILTQALRSRWSSSPTVIDNGISLGLGPKKWLLSGFEPIKVVKAPRQDQPIVPGEMEPDEEVQAQVDYLTGLSPLVGRIVGYDALPIRPGDHDSINRVLSHTFPMSESLRRPKEVEEFIRLAHSSSPKVNLLHRNIIHAEDPESLAQIAEFLPNGKADIGIFSAIFFEQRPDIVSTILENMRPYYNENALFFVTDFAKADPNSPGGLKFIRGDWWHRPGSFATFIIDPFKLEQRPIEICRFSTRRGTEMWLTDAGRKIVLEAAENS